MKEKEEKAKERIKRDHSSMSPQPGRADKQSDYVIKLAKNARERQKSIKNTLSINEVGEREKSPPHNSTLESFIEQMRQ